MPLIIVQLQHVAHAWRMRYTNFQENPSKRSGDTAKKVRCFPSGEALISNPWDPNLHRLFGMRAKYEVWILKKIYSVFSEVQPERHIARQVECT